MLSPRAFFALAVTCVLLVVAAMPRTAQAHDTAPAAPPVAYVLQPAPVPVWPTPIRRGLHALFAPRWVQPGPVLVAPQPAASWCPTCGQYHPPGPLR